MTAGRDDLTSNNMKKDYFFARDMEITPHPNQGLKSVLGRPVMDRKLKYTLLESTLTGSNATSATPLNLINISQGTTDITRTGDRVRAKRIWFQGKVTGNAAATGAIATRVLVVLWNPPGVGGVNNPVASQVIQHSASYGPYGAYSRDYGDSYQVVYDAVVQAKPPGVTVDSEMIRFDRKVLIDMEFSAGATTPSVNTLFVFCLTDSGINQPTLLFSSTVWYDDLDA